MKKMEDTAEVALSLFIATLVIVWIFTATIWAFINEGKKDVMKYEIEKLRIEKGVPEPIHIDIIE